MIYSTSVNVSEHTARTRWICPQLICMWRTGTLVFSRVWEPPVRASQSSQSSSSFSQIRICDPFCISGCIWHLEPLLILLKSIIAVWLQSDKSHFISPRSFKPTCYIDCQQQPKLAVSHTVDLSIHCCHGSFNAQINTSNQSLTASGRQTDGWLLRLRPTWKNIRRLTETILDFM